MPYPPIQVDKSKDLEKWMVFPESLPNGRFTGFANREDQSMLRGSFVIGQNMGFGGAFLPATRQGYQVVGTEPTDATPVKRAWVYETRDGVQFELKVFGTTLYYWIEGVSTAYALLKGGLTANTEWTFNNIGITAEATSHCVFSNGVDGVYRFNGAHVAVASGTVNTITLQGATTWTALGFYTTGTRSVIINGVEYGYTGGEGTDTLTGVTVDASGLVAGDMAVQSPQVVAALATVQGSVGLAHDGRLHLRREDKKSTWVYSQLDDPFDFTSGSSDGDGGTKDVEFGGPIVAFGKLNKTILCLKKRTIKMLDFLQYGARVDAPRYQTLMSVDDKGTSLGATNAKSTFSTPMGMVFVTPDKKLALLSGITANNEPQYLFLSDPIQPIFDNGVFDDATGICVNNIIWLAFKSDSNSSYNDVVLRGDMTRQSIDSFGRVLPIRWDTPYIGWNVSDWTVLFDPAGNKVRWHSSLNSGTYELINDKADNSQPFTSICRTWAEHFDFPQHHKRIEEVFIEVRMTENTEILATLLYDEDGYTSQKEILLTGGEANYKFGGAIYNPMGASAFGSVKFGSNPDSSVLPVYRFNLEVNPNIYFFNISLQLSSDTDGQNFELIRFGYKLSEIVKDTDRKYLHQ